MRKINTYLVLGLFLTAMLSVAGCRKETDITPSNVPAESQSESTDELNVKPEMIYEARCQYIGEAPAVGKLAGLLKS